MPQEEMSTNCKPALRTAFLLTSAMSVVGTANVQTEIILGAFHLCSLFYEVNRVNYLLAKIEELPALDNVRFSLK